MTFFKQLNFEYILYYNVSSSSSVSLHHVDDAMLI